MGYHRAGFEVIGVDINPQPHYPFEFHQADVLEVLRVLISGDCIKVGTMLMSSKVFNAAQGHNLYLKDIVAFHASPPCYENTWSARRWIDGQVPYDKQDKMNETRELLLSIGKPFILENTPGADMNNFIKLYGTMFGLKVIRERWFELHGFEIFMLPSPFVIKSPIASGKYFTVAGHGGDSKDCRLATWQQAMGIDWMTKTELTQAIPPAYTEYIGKYLLEALGDKRIIQ